MHRELSAKLYVTGFRDGVYAVVVENGRMWECDEICKGCGFLRIVSGSQEFQRSQHNFWRELYGDEVDEFTGRRHHVGILIVPMTYRRPERWIPISVRG